MSNNQTKPNQTQTTPSRAREGISRSRVQVQKPGYAQSVTDRPPMREVYADELAWAERHLPDEYGPFVALAIESLKRQGRKPSTRSVLEHLRVLNRDAAFREAENG